MDTQYVERADVLLSEEMEEELTFLGEVVSVHWTARLDGFLNPSGEGVILERTGPSAERAMEALQVAIKEQGWELR